MTMRHAGFACALMVASLCLAACKPDSAPAAAASAQVAGLETPQPAGPQGVGVTERDKGWLIYYPTKKPGAASSAPAMPQVHVGALTRRFGPVVAEALASGTGYAASNVRPAAGRWPVLVFAPGWHMMAQDYRALLEDVASRGYVVIARESLPEGSSPPYAAATKALADGQVLAAKIGADPMDWLNTAIDAKQVVLIGHSVGGAAAVLAASRDVSVKGAINLDGDYGGETAAARPTTPVLYLLSYTPDEAQRSIDRRAEAWRQVRHGSNATLALQVQGFKHLNFLDAALLAEQVPLKQRATGFGYYIPAAGLRLTADLVTGFCDEHLKGRAGALHDAQQRWPDAVPLAQ